MNELERVVNIVLEREKKNLSNSTFQVRRGYLKRLIKHGNKVGISSPCQELFDSFVSEATTKELRFQYYHAVRLVDKEAATKAVQPNGRLFNEPTLPSMEEAMDQFSIITYPVPDSTIDLGILIRKAEVAMTHLQLSTSTNGQYVQAWQELYTFLYTTLGNTTFVRDSCNAFIDDTIQKYKEGRVPEWKRKIRMRAVNVLMEVADTGYFEWKLFCSRHPHCCSDSLEELRAQYNHYLKTQNLEKKTIILYDYAFRVLVEEIDIKDVTDLQEIQPSQIQNMVESISQRFSLNSLGTVLPVIRSILTFLYAAGFMTQNYSGMIMTPAHRENHLRPYISSDDEKKVIDLLDEAPLRTRAMMRISIRLGLRDSDICNLQLKQIDWYNDCITLEQDKTGNAICLPLLEDVGNAIMDYIMHERPVTKSPYVFVRMQAPHKKLNSMYSICSRLLKKADVTVINGKGLGTHTCRHTLTHKLLASKVPHQVITDTLGHVSKEADKPYMSMEEHMLKECPLSLELVGQKYWKEGECNE